MEARSKDNAADQLREKAAEIKEDIRELGAITKDAAAEWYKEGRDKAIKLEKGFENRIREHPLQSVVIAAGVGFLAGYLISRRR